MPNFKKHSVTGFLVGSGVAIIGNFCKQLIDGQNDPAYKFNWAELGITTLLGGAVGTACGVLPDIIEPANCSSHRKLFHSITAGSLVVFGIFEASQSSLSPVAKSIITSAGAGYLSHLLLDNGTPMGIPLV